MSKIKTIIGAASLVLTATLPMTAHAIQPGTYEIRAVHSGKCMDVSEVSTVDGATVHQWECVGQNNQRWQVTPYGQGYHLIALHSGKCLDVRDWSYSNGGVLQQWSCGGGTNQQWYINDLGNGQYSIQAVHSGLVADVSGPSWDNGAVIHQWTNYFANNQKWTFNLLIEPVQYSGNPGTAPGFSSVVNESQFNQMFPQRNGFYTYRGLVDASLYYPAFTTTGDITTRKREAAAALANFSHETGGLVYVNELNQSSNYCSGTATPCGVCASGKHYRGRGPLQLSWNYNYCTAGRALGLNLWGNPDLVSTNATVAWRTGLWFWMTQSGAGYRPAHQSMVNGNGFGETIRSINGTLECNGANSAQAQDRINTYLRFIKILGTTAGSNLGC
jgi:chitinase